MAIDPAAISASPPTTINLVSCTAPESPAARAKGTVSPSAMPITTSRTNSPAVKCFSICGARGIASNLRMIFQIFLGPANHITFPSIRQLQASVFEWNPQSTLDLNAHRGINFVDISGLIFQQIKTHDFENPLLVPPGAHINILDISQLGNRSRDQPGFLSHLANGRLVGLFTRVHQPL